MTTSRRTAAQSSLMIDYTKSADKITQIYQTIITLDAMLQAEDTLSKRRALSKALDYADDSLEATIKVKADLKKYLNGVDDA